MIEAFDDLLKEAKESSIPIYAIAFSDGAVEQSRGLDQLRLLTSETGGFLTIAGRTRAQALGLRWEGALSFRCHGVHVTQAISQRFHHMSGKVWVLLNEKMEPPLINRRQPAGRFSYCVSCARAVIKQRHLADQRAYPCSFANKITQTKVDLPFQQHVHTVASISFPEQKIARCELDGVGPLTKKFSRIHRYAAYRRTLASSKLQLCVTGALNGRGQAYASLQAWVAPRTPPTR